MTESDKIDPYKDLPLKKWIRTDRLPFIFCSGCTIGTIIQTVAYVLEKEGYKRKEIVVVSGIGCSGRASGYFRTGTFHSTHGRALTVATGIKVANPKLKVVVLSGDGDLSSIGGNHLIHAARRNIDITVVEMNNYIYGMTGGQAAPTTPPHAFSQTTPHGNIDPQWNLIPLVAYSGATFLARWTSFHIHRTRETLTKALKHKGFSFVEIVFPCPTEFGHLNRLETPVEMMKKMLDVCEVSVEKGPWEAEIDWTKRIVLGEFLAEEKAEYTQQLADLRKRIMQKEKDKIAETKKETEEEIEEESSPFELLSFGHPTTKEQSITEMIVAGSGGQGIISFARLLTKATFDSEGRYCTQSQNYGPEARGGLTFSQILIADEPVPFPQVTEPDILVLLSKRGLDRFLKLIPEVKTVFYDPESITIDHSIAPETTFYSVEATRIAIEVIEARQVANIIMLGALTSITEVVGEKAMKETIAARWPRYKELNLRAFDEGIAIGSKLKENKEDLV
jgi:2-oxoglutarate ferredoxin oxidoreductase subunit beta